MKQVILIDYGSGNLTSASKALSKVSPNDCAISLTNDPTRLMEADFLILPGVGAFGNSMQALQKNGLAQAIQTYIQSGKPFLGICVGMQLLADFGMEHGSHEGLGLIKGNVGILPKNEGLAVPNIGWHPLVFTQNHILHQGLTTQKDWFYFVHSYAFYADDPTCIASQFSYGVDITASIAKDNIYACQFHPEKSQKVGQILLHNFLRWRP